MEITLKVTHIAGDLGPLDLKVHWLRCIASSRIPLDRLSPRCTTCTSATHPLASFGAYTARCCVCRQHTRSTNTANHQDLHQVLGQRHPAANVLPGQPDARQRAQPVQPAPVPQLPCLGGGALPLPATLQLWHHQRTHRRSTTSRSSSTKQMTRYATIRAPPHSHISPAGILQWYNTALRVPEDQWGWWQSVLDHVRCNSTLRAGQCTSPWLCAGAQHSSTGRNGQAPRVELPSLHIPCACSSFVLFPCKFYQVLLHMQPIRIIGHRHTRRKHQQRTDDAAPHPP